MINKLSSVQLFKQLLMSFALMACCCYSPSLVLAQRNLTDIPSPDPELERKTFILPEGFEVNLFAADPQIAKPIQMNFDPQGRLWIASSSVYPHIEPGKKANDRILVIEDKDGDGRADSTTVFAEGLLIPTAVIPGDGGAYVGNSTELIHLKDTNGDGKADVRKTVLDGFGTEDTHHILHTLRWGPGGHLYFNQSIYIHSHIETPHGVQRLNGGGIWKFRPETMDLEVVMRGMVNSWGHHFDKWGQSFATDGAYGHGINYTFPGAAFVTAVGPKRILKGLNLGSPKHCGLEIVSGRHLPDDWQGNMITNDFRGHRVCRFVVTENKAGYISREQVEVIKTNHVAFRPIDVKMGPDGAIYIADWYNPIIQHGEVDFRDPRRDHTHGRIWRVTYKGKPTLKRPQLVNATNRELLNALKLPEEWTRQNAKNVLRERGAARVEKDLLDWFDQLDANDKQVEHHRLEGLWVAQSIRSVQPELLKACLTAKDGRVRAAAVRVARHWKTELEQPFILIAPLTNDAHPRVRLEAVRALSHFQNKNVLPLALEALDHPVDEYLDYALWLTARESKATWFPALESGKQTLVSDPAKLIFALNAVDSPEITPLLIRLLKSKQISKTDEQKVISLVAKFGNPTQLRFLFDYSLRKILSANQKSFLLRQLANTFRARRVKPVGELKGLGQHIISAEPEVQLAAVHCAGLWKEKMFEKRIREFMLSKQTSLALKQESMKAVARLGGAENQQLLLNIIDSNRADEIRITAVTALADLNFSLAAKQAIKILNTVKPDDKTITLINTFLQRKGGPQALAVALKGEQLTKDVAISLSRRVQSAGRPLPGLLKAVRTAGKLSTSSSPQAILLSPAEMTAMVNAVKAKGNAERGEMIYRRQELLCLKCHAIGGAGGKVGPDMISLGGSAQLDYIVDALLNPNKAVKENYNAISVVTDQGKVYSGVLVQRTDSDVVLRDADDKITKIPLDQIDDEAPAASLMPVGATANLTQTELVDLVRFLSALGKSEKYIVGKSRVVRRWRVMKGTKEAYTRIRRTRHATAATDDPAFTWEPAYSKVDGNLPVNGFAEVGALRVSKKSRGASFVRCELDVTTAGKTVLKFNSVEGLDLWIGEKPVKLSAETTLDLTTGRHRLTFAIHQTQKRKFLRVELVDAPESKARVSIVNGK